MLRDGTSATLSYEGAVSKTADTALTRSRGFVCMIAYTNYAVDARVRREAETLAAHGYHVLCLTTQNGPVPSRFVLNGVQVRELGVPKFRGKSTVAYVRFYVRFLLAASMQCLRLLGRGELDVVHVHNMPDFLVFAGLLPRLFGRKVILDIHDSVPETFAAKFAGRSSFWNILCLEEKLSALVAHRIVCVNHPQRDTLVARGIPSPKTFISMNVPDPAMFKRGVPGRNAPQSLETFNLVYHGTMVERLGVDLLIRAVARLRHRIPAIRLHLWGNGDDLPGFQSLVGALGLEEMVVFRPEGFPVQELAGRLQSMQLCVIGNRRSIACDLMLPVKLMECVALGIPAVAPRLKTIEHYFSDEMVAYYEAENVESMANAIDRMHREPSERDRQVERAGEFLMKYGWERQSTELVSFYQQLLEI
jgi:glycosyltransferase involved in cell wall biosynthesis